MTNKHDDAAAELLIREVDEELRQDQAAQLWKKYGNVVIGGAVALVLAVAGWQGWNAWQANQRQDSSARYAAALDQAGAGKAQEASEDLAALAADGTAGYRVLARLQQAGLALKGGDRERAVTLYEAVAADGGVDGAYRDLARLKAAYLKLDGGDPAAIEAAAQPLAAESNPWRHSARELLALAALKRGDRARAADLFGKLAADSAAPQGLRSRAAEMLDSLGGKASG